MASWSGTFTDTVSPCYQALWERFEQMKLLLETLDWTAANDAEQQEAHAFLDRLEYWMEELETWDQAEMERSRLESLNLTLPLFDER
jgi:hypothetical protein